MAGFKKYNSRDVIQSGIKSVPCPSAQSNTMYVTYNSQFAEIPDHIRIVERFKSIDYSMYVFLRILFDNGLRVSELLSVSGRDVSNSFMIRIRAKKNSNDRLVNASEFKDFLISKRFCSGLIFSSYNRFYIYRVMKSAGLSAIFGENKNKSVTHYARHQFALSNQSLTDPSFSTSKLLGHKSDNNGKYYEKIENVH